MPVSLGGKGFCGPAQCVNAKTNVAGCVLTNKPIDYAAAVAKYTCKSCTQSTDARCSSSALAAAVKGSGIRAAYCTDKHLVIISDAKPQWTPNLDDTPNPPGATVNGAPCVTRMSSVTEALLVSRIPLTVSLLPTAANTNNMAAYPDGGADSNSGYMVGASASYGLPTRGAVGVTVNGQEIYPLYNNRAELTPDSCEADSCNEHVGQGGGQPHLHGDPFGSWCLYSAANYSTLAAHPPQIGWASDGPTIYGRYLSVNAPGYATALDDCGGHTHGDYGYHYHTQVIDAVTGSGAARGLSAGVAYAASTPGPYKCFRGDLSQVLGFWEGPGSTYNKPCCGMANFYVASGIAVNGAGTQAAATPVTTGNAAARATAHAAWAQLLTLAAAAAALVVAVPGMRL